MTLAKSCQKKKTRSKRVDDLVSQVYSANCYKNEKKLGERERERHVMITIFTQDAFIMVHHINMIYITRV